MWVENFGAGSAREARTSHTWRPACPALLMLSLVIRSRGVCQTSSLGRAAVSGQRVTIGCLHQQRVGSACISDLPGRAAANSRQVCAHLLHSPVRCCFIESAMLVFFLKSSVFKKQIHLSIRRTLVLRKTCHRCVWAPSRRGESDGQEPKTVIVNGVQAATKARLFS